MNSKHFDNARVFKAFCDENRLIILEMLQSGEKCACVLLEKLEISQPTLSHHMKILVDSGVVAARKEGKWTYYSISAQGSENAAKLLRELTTVAIDEADYIINQLENQSGFQAASEACLHAEGM